MPLTLLLHGRHAPPPNSLVEGHARDAVMYQPLGPWLVPWRFISFEAEYETLRSGIGLIDYSSQAMIEVRGADRVSFLQALLTNDIKVLAPGRGCRTALLDPSAKLIAEFVVFADPDALWLLCSLDRAGIVMQALDRYLFSEQVTLTNHERRWAVLALQGPQTMEWLRTVFGVVGSDTLLEEASHHMVSDPARLGFDTGGLRIVRHSLTDEPGLLCLVNAEEALARWERRTQRGRPDRLTPVGWEALNTARIEAGIPWFGIDMDTTNLLPETGLDAELASETKGCYVGQEIIARMRTYGSPNKKLMGLLMDGERIPEAGDAIVRAGETLGQVTSACYSPALRCPIAMGYVKRGAYEPGTAVEIARGDARFPATIAARPLVQKYRPRSTVHRPQ